jgi:hypothetical protein
LAISEGAACFRVCLDDGATCLALGEPERETCGQRRRPTGGTSRNRRLAFVHSPSLRQGLVSSPHGFQRSLIIIAWWRHMLCMRFRETETRKKGECDCYFFISRDIIVIMVASTKSTPGRNRRFMSGYGCGDTVVAKLKASLLSPTLITAFSLTCAAKVGVLINVESLKILLDTHTSVSVSPGRTVISTRQLPEATANCSPALANTRGIDFSPSASSAINTIYVGVGATGSALALIAPVMEPATRMAAIERVPTRRREPDVDSCICMMYFLVR